MGIITAVSMIVLGLVLGFAVTISPSWLSIGMLGTSLFVGGLAGLLIIILGRVSHARRERWHAIGPWLIAVGLIVWLAIHEPYIKGLDLLSLGFITAMAGVVLTGAAAYLVSPWRGRGIIANWIRPPHRPADETQYYGQPPQQQSYEPYQPYQPYPDNDRTAVLRPPEDRPR